MEEKNSVVYVWSLLIYLVFVNSLTSFRNYLVLSLYIQGVYVCVYSTLSYVYVCVYCTFSYVYMCVYIHRVICMHVYIYDTDVPVQFCLKNTARDFLPIARYKHFNVSIIQETHDEYCCYVVKHLYQPAFINIYTCILIINIINTVELR